MLPSQTIGSQGELQIAVAGARLLSRGVTSGCVLYLESGRVALGVMEACVMEHQLGVLEGPCWLEASCAVLNLPQVVDALAESEVTVRRVPLSEFHRSLGAISAGARAVLHDVAMAHRQQTEFTVSRLAKDAESRCAEWLLRHAETGDTGVLAVLLQLRKRSIAAQLGIAPETFSRILRHLREQSLITGSGRVLNLVDPPGLRSLARV